MIRLQVPGFYNSDKGGPRWGDAQIFDDGKNFDVIDGYCGVGTTHLLDTLEERKILKPNLYITHPHYDHYYGIREIIRSKDFKPSKLYGPSLDSYGDVSSEVRSNKQALKDIYAEAKAKKIPIVYLKNGNKIVHGDIKFTVFQNTSNKYDGNSEGYVNDRSLAFWYPELAYLTTGDGPTKVNDSVMPILVKIGHHGNWCIRTMATWLKNHGCKYCWDNDYSTYITDFLETGREDCIAVGMKYISCHGDINIIWFSKKAVIYKGNDVYRYSCSYTGKATIKDADLDIVKTVLKGKAKSDDARISYLLNHGYNPGLVQKQVNEIIQLVKG